MALADNDTSSTFNYMTAVAIDHDKNSMYAARYAIENLLTRDNTTLILIHVINRTLESQVPGVSGTYTGGDGTDSIDAGLQQLFNRFRGYCARKRIEMKEVILEDSDVPKAIVKYVCDNAIANIVLGASVRSALARKFRNHDVPGTVYKNVPDFCSVYIIGRNKVQDQRIASRPLANSAAPPKFTAVLTPLHSPDNSDAEDGDKVQSVRGDLRNVASEKIILRKGLGSMSLDNLELPGRGTRNAAKCNSLGSGDIDFSSPMKFGSIDITGSDSDFSIAPYSFEDKIQAPKTPPSLTKEKEAEMRRLKLELQQTMSMYNAACKEAVSAKQQARELHQYKVEEARRLEQARLSEEAARAIVEMEKARCRAALEAAEKAQKIAEMESQRRRYAEKRAKREADEKQRALKVLSNNHIRYRKYTIDEIEVATNHFASNYKIGEGGYGPVYKGKLDHTLVAIKVLRPDAAQGRKQFNQEVEILSCMRHPNMVLLLGACPEYGCLVYEFMNNGSLEDRLFRKGNSPPLPWKIRFQIAADIATGLLFLHQSKPEPLVHRDLKPANILLDRNYVCKISDVGLSRLVPATVADSVTQYHLTSAAGTFCYIDPEYQQTGKLTVKSDIYSLGIMLLQVITARPPMGLTHHVEKAISKGTFKDILDPALSDWPVEEALCFAKLALKCSELRKRDRPDLGSDVLPELNRLAELGSNST